MKKLAIALLLVLTSTPGHSFPFFHHKPKKEDAQDVELRHKINKYIDQKEEQLVKLSSARPDLFDSQLVPAEVDIVLIRELENKNLHDPRIGELVLDLHSRMLFILTIEDYTIL